MYFPTPDTAEFSRRILPEPGKTAKKFAVSGARGRRKIHTKLTWWHGAEKRDGAAATRLTRGHLNVKRGEGHTELRNNFWSQRVVDPWNALPDQVKQAESLNVFKNGIDNLLFKK